MATHEVFPVITTRNSPIHTSEKQLTTQTLLKCRHNLTRDASPHLDSLAPDIDSCTSTPMIIDPHYPHIVLAFPYRGLTIEIEQTTFDDMTVYAAWVTYESGSAVAVPKAWTRADAIQRAKRWVDRKFD